MAIVTVIGLGSMGIGMANSVLRAGHEVWGLDISEARMEAFVAGGGKSGTIAEAAGASGASGVKATSGGGRRWREAVQGPRPVGFRK